MNETDDTELERGFVANPEGHSYQNIGLKPDVEVAMPKDVDVRELRMKYDAPRRLEQDKQLKAAVELIEAS